MTNRKNCNFSNYNLVSKVLIDAITYSFIRFSSNFNIAFPFTISTKKYINVIHPVLRNIIP